jgi:hypothetical protein
MAKAATTTDLADAFARGRRHSKFLKFLMASSAIPDFKNFGSLPSGKIASPDRLGRRIFLDRVDF